MAHPLHERVRERYVHCCGYCSVSETESGGELTVDHYRPPGCGGDDELDNLVYCCHRCNEYKGKYWPSPDDEARGLRVLHPLGDDIQQHVRLGDGSGRLEPISETGRFHIELLHLNRPALVRHRLKEWRRRLQDEERELLRAECDRLRSLVKQQEEWIETVKRSLGLTDTDFKP